MLFGISNPNYALPQFHAVIESCSKVASETHTKYGIWARLTQR